MKGLSQYMAYSALTLWILSLTTSAVAVPHRSTITQTAKAEKLTNHQILSSAEFSKRICQALNKKYPGHSFHVDPKIDTKN